MLVLKNSKKKSKTDLAPRAKIHIPEYEPVELCFSCMIIVANFETLFCIIMGKKRLFISKSRTQDDDNDDDDDTFCGRMSVEFVANRWIMLMMAELDQ